MINQVTTEPAHVPGCFKMFNTTGANRGEPGRISRTGVNRGDAVAIPAHSVAPTGVSLPLYTGRNEDPGVEPVEPG